MKKHNIAAFGDSVVRGVIYNPQDSSKYSIPEKNFTEQCSERLGVEVMNFAKFGSTISSGEAILERHIREIGGFYHTLLGFGGNDSDFDWNAIAGNPSGKHQPRTAIVPFALSYKKIISRVKAAGSRPVMLSLTPMDPQRYFEHVTRNMDEKMKANVLRWLGGDTGYIANWHEMYNIEVFKIATALKVPLIDITSAFLAHRNIKSLLCADGIHPNASGQKLIADSVCAALA